MSNYVTLCNLESTGELKSLVRSGIMPVKIGTHLEIYRLVDARVKTGTKKMEAIIEASVKFKVCEKTVFNILRSIR